MLAASFNLLTSQQPWAAERLARHAGKTLRISLGGFSVTFTIDMQGQLAQSDEAIVPDVVLDVMTDKLSVSGLFDTAGRQDIAEYVHISGQAALAQVVSDLARDLRPDPEEALSRWLGDIPARRVVEGLKGLFSAVQNASKSLTQNTAEYLSEESGALAGRPVMTMHVEKQQQLIARLDELAARQARLSARLEKLDTRLGTRA